MSSWLTTHLETFVKPRLGFIPPKVDFFTPEELTIIKNWWRSAKAAAGSRPMLLAGRDAFVFEVLARRENYPTTFRPDISRATVSYVKENYRDYYLLDTGFAGSIARRLGITHFGLASAGRLMFDKNPQIFPRLTGARALALKIEATPKYWTSGKWIQTHFPRPTHDFEDDFWSYSSEKITSEEVKIIQDLASEEEFIRAAGVTIQVYTNSARKFINKPKPVQTGRWQDSKLTGW